MRIAAWVDDNRRWFLPTFLALFVLVVGLLVFWMINLRGLSHLTDSFAVWRHQTFGGVRSIHSGSFNVYAEMQASDRKEFNRLDIAALTLYVTGTSMTNLLDDVSARDGQIRVIVLDPRWSRSKHPEHFRFEALAQSFGQEPWELAAECRHSTALLLRLEQTYKNRIEIRFHRGPSKLATGPFLLPARTYQLYGTEEATIRFDTMIPRTATGTDSVRHPAVSVNSRPHDASVRQATRVFDEQWENGVILDDDLALALLEEFQE